MSKGKCSQWYDIKSCFNCAGNSVGCNGADAKGVLRKNIEEPADRASQDTKNCSRKIMILYISQSTLLKNFKITKSPPTRRISSRTGKACFLYPKPIAEFYGLDKFLPSICPKPGTCNKIEIIDHQRRATINTVEENVTTSTELI